MVATVAMFCGLVLEADSVRERRRVDPKDHLRENRGLESKDPLPQSFERTLVVGKTRFVFLTSWAVRVERSPTLVFEDRPTLIFSTREEFLANEAPVRVDVEVDGGVLTLTTFRMRLRYGNERESYTISPELSSATLVADIKKGEAWVTWKQGRRNLGNLFGTRRTLDHTDGEADLEPGLLSRSGWSEVDDTLSPTLEGGKVYGELSWARERSQMTGYKDIYLFGYGHNMKEMLQTYVNLAGRVPIPPRFSLGLWWSRWWPYSDQEFKDLVKEFKENKVPLDVLVVDMDWHLTAYELMNMGYADLSGQPLGWTGYTWNRTLFPEPEKFLTWCHDRGLRTTLNLHPAGGVQPWEDVYPTIAKAMGVDPDPKARQFVAFDIADQKFATAYFDHVLRPLERQGVDFWWLDWQQENVTTIANLNPTIWLNHVFFQDMERRRPQVIPQRPNPRGIIFHRWGGLGSHRYQVGFSGDVTTSWPSLRFQVYFTLTAANVAFGHWSHDIGGFLSRVRTPPELFTRWVQWGAVSAVFRTHAWRKEYLERRIWKYPARHFLAMREAIRFRFSLVPTLYSLNRLFYDTGIAPIYPLYYDYPKDDRAYDYSTQFKLGPDMVVSPVVDEMSKEGGVHQPVFIPTGTWVEWHTGVSLTGPVEVQRFEALEDLPIYIRAGTPLFMAIPASNIEETSQDPTVITFFPGPELASGSAHLYQDDGLTTDYKQKTAEEGGFAKSTVTAECNLPSASCRFYLEPPVGSYGGMLTERSLLLRIAYVPPPDRVTVDGVSYGREKPGVVKTADDLSPTYREWSMRRPSSDPSLSSTTKTPSHGSWSYDGERFTVEARTDLVAVSSPLLVEVHWSDPDTLQRGLDFLHRGIYGRLRYIGRAVASNTDHKLTEWRDILLTSFDAGKVNPSSHVLPQTDGRNSNRSTGGSLKKPQHKHLSAVRSPQCVFRLFPLEFFFVFHSETKASAVLRIFLAACFLSFPSIFTWCHPPRDSSGKWGRGC